MKKIIDDYFIKTKIDKLKSKGSKIGLCHGVFDLLHIGHIKHFTEAKKNCDILIVSVTHDKFVFKGPGRPAFDHNIRMESISALENVDYVYLSKTATAKNTISLIKPNFYFKGPDYKNNKEDLTGEIENEITTLKKNKGKIFYTSAKKYSSSSLINEHLINLSQNQKNIFNRIKKKFNFTKIEKIIKNLENITPLIVGETIIDQYTFSEALGKSGKEPVLVLKELSSEKYLGGAAAICNNLSNFCKKINLLSMIGEKSEEIRFIKKKLSSKVKSFFHKKYNSPTIIKKRFIDQINKTKVLGLYSIDDSLLKSNEKKIIRNQFNKLSKKTGLTIIADYGHGFIDKDFVNHIKKKSKFIAANVQINAANIGFHTLQNYTEIDFLIVNEREIRHEMRSKNDDLNMMIKKISHKQKINFIIATRGTEGCILYDKKNNKFFHSDAFEKFAKDKVGAGDTMLAISALCVYSKIDFELTLLISSLCAAQNTRIFANEKSISKKQLFKSLQHILL